MSRLTEKDENNNYVIATSNFHDCFPYCYQEDLEKAVNKIINNYGKIEDIEQQLKISLITLFKSLNNKIYIKTSEEHYVSFCDIEQDSYGDYYFSLICGDFYFKDYGRTWALTKKELEQ